MKDFVYRRCCELDVHKDTIATCVRWIEDGGESRPAIRSQAAVGIHEGVRVERAGTERAGVERSRDELPEGIELGELRAGRMVLVRGAVVDVGGDPHDVADALRLEVSQQVGDLQFAAERRQLGRGLAVPVVVERLVAHAIARAEGLPAPAIPNPATGPHPKISIPNRPPPFAARAVLGAQSMRMPSNTMVISVIGAMIQMALRY